MDIPIEKRFQVLCEIVRAQHFAWREAALSMAPDLDPRELVNKMWQITGVETAKFYLKQLDPDSPLPAQVAECIVASSICMGEDAIVEKGENDEAFVKHLDCPWYHQHKRMNLLAEDQPGCDTWFFTVVAEINKALGTSIKIETMCSLPEGGACCNRRIWTEQ